MDEIPFFKARRRLNLSYFALIAFLCFLFTTFLIGWRVGVCAINEKSRYKWLILFYMYTGTRRNEAIALEWNDINRTEKLIQIKGTKTETSARNILLTDEVETILNGQKKQNEERGIKGRRVFPYSAQQASRHFKTLCPNHHLHELRHTFITRCAESGVNVNVCQQLVGHASADMTINVYTHVMDEFKRKEAAKFSLFPTF